MYCGETSIQIDPHFLFPSKVDVLWSLYGKQGTCFASFGLHVVKSCHRFSTPFPWKTVVTFLSWTPSLSVVISMWWRKKHTTLELTFWKKKVQLSERIHWGFSEEGFRVKWGCQLCVTHWPIWVISHVEIQFFFSCWINSFLLMLKQHCGIHNLFLRAETVHIQVRFLVYGDVDACWWRMHPLFSVCRIILTLNTRKSSSTLISHFPGGFLSMNGIKV